MTIPKIIHQIWIYQDIEKNSTWAKRKFSESIQSWKRHHPDFDYIFWSNSDIFKLIHDFFPDIVPKIKQIDSKDIIILADIARLCILYIYGGIYSDLDIIAYRNYSELLNVNKIIFPKTEPFGFSNDLIISPKNNLLIKKCIDNLIIKNYIPNRGLRVLYSCGPLFITEQLFKNSGCFITLPPEYYEGHLEGSTWLTENESNMKNFVLDIINISDFNNLKREIYKKEIDKKNLVNLYEYLDILYIILIFYNINYLKSYYIFRILDIFKCSSRNKTKQLNVIIHSIYRLSNVYLMEEENEMYKWLRDLSLVSITEMKSISVNSKIKNLINIYVLTKHIYLILNSLIKKKRVYKNIENKKFLCFHLSESFLHFFLLTDRNFIKN
jgi:mannosyltransferase OCH1-like enzyme